MIRKLGYFIVLCLLFAVCNSLSIYGQNNLTGTEDSIRPGRLTLVISVESAVAAGALIGLNELWYKDYPRSSFHFFDDSREWLQMDKAAHTFTSYQLGRLGYSCLRWTGLSENKSAWYGGSMGSMYMIIIEILDGFSKEWGFSWTDFLANTAGSSLFIGQQLGWHEQRLLIKHSYHPSPYASYRPDLLGENLPEKILKDYNGTTFWLCASIGSFLKSEKKFPHWICLSLGYSAEGLLGGNSNPDSYNGDPLPCYDRNRRFLLTADIDFTQIPTRSKALKTFFSILNVFKVPFPAIEINSKGKIKGHYFYF